jgi:hypothetical protein
MMSVLYEESELSTMEDVRGHPYDGDASYLAHDENRWTSWPVFWTPVWVGALASLALALVIGLIAAAIGAHEVGPSSRAVTYHDIRFGALFFGVFGAFLAFFLGGWVAARIAGIRRAEPAMLHGAIVWLLALPLLFGLVALGAGSLYGDWYGGLAGRPAWATDQTAVAPVVPPGTAITPNGSVRPAPGNAPAVADPDAARAARNAALGTLTALLLGLVGGVLGGWAGSGEPMTFTHYRRRPLLDRHSDQAHGRPEMPPASTLVPPAIRHDEPHAA